MSMECMGVRLIDSMSFVAQALESFPKTFGESELKKGHFPYLFYKEENLQYVGAFPDADQYCPARKPAKKRTDFYNWYKLAKNGIFDMDKEADEYCESDVAILMRCMRKFDDLFFGITGIRPLSNSISIAQVCNYTWRKNFMDRDSVAIMPPDGYNSGDRISKQAQEWLAWYGHQNGVRIQHGRNGKEHKVGKYKVTTINLYLKTRLNYILLNIEYI